ncbi:MAG: hypothetical protein D6782_02825 [Alphaproteobacteria bacterium]|nr:MAG: hypothetical protein D6782_02825 [Alphaproteobacteria bacterium]
MNLDQIPLFAAIKQRLQWLSARQELIAENVANANAPGYVPMTLKPQDFSDLVNSVGGADKRRHDGTAMRRTQAQHFDLGSASGERRLQPERVDKVFERLPNGNAVVLEQEMIDQAQTQIEYNMLLNLYRKHGAMLRTAIGHRGSGGG